MASTITASTLKVTIREDIKLNGVQQGGVNTLSIGSITNAVKRIVNIGTDEIGLLGFGTAYNTELSKTYLAGQFDEDTVRYIRITNLDDTNFAILRITGDTSTDFAVRLDPSSSYIITSTSSTGLDDYADISGVTLEDLLAVSATADTAAVDLELFVASI